MLVAVDVVGRSAEWFAGGRTAGLPATIPTPNLAGVSYAPVTRTAAAAVAGTSSWAGRRESRPPAGSVDSIPLSDLGQPSSGPIAPGVDPVTGRPRAFDPVYERAKAYAASPEGQAANAAVSSLLDDDEPVVL